MIGPILYQIDYLILLKIPISMGDFLILLNHDLEKNEHPEHS